MAWLLHRRAFGCLRNKVTLPGAVLSHNACHPHACELNIYLSTISCLQRHFWELWSPTSHRPCVTTSAQDLLIQHLHLQDGLRPAAWTAAATIGLTDQKTSPQTTRNQLREARLDPHHPHQGQMQFLVRMDLIEKCSLSVAFALNSCLHRLIQVLDR